MQTSKPVVFLPFSDFLTVYVTQITKNDIRNLLQSTYFQKKWSPYGGSSLCPSQSSKVIAND